MQHVFKKPRFNEHSQVLKQFRAVRREDCVVGQCRPQLPPATADYKGSTRCQTGAGCSTLGVRAAGVGLTALDSVMRFGRWPHSKKGAPGSPLYAQAPRGRLRVRERVRDRASDRRSAGETQRQRDRAREKERERERESKPERGGERERERNCVCVCDVFKLMLLFL